MASAIRTRFPIDKDACRARQQRLLAEMQRLRLDLVVVTQTEHVQWLAGPRFKWFFAPCAAISADGRVTLVAPNATVDAAADEVVTYEAQWKCTLRNDQRAASTEALHRALAGGSKPARLGVEFSSCGPQLSAVATELVDIEPSLYALRRRKDAHELALLKQAIAATAAMYAHAREIVAPGVNELRVFNELQSVAVEVFGESPTATGNDYACGQFSGPARDRAIEAGELYILDLGPAFRGYFADNCRTIAVDRKPTNAQLDAWDRVVAVLNHVERVVKPGKSCRELFQEADAMLNQQANWKFHHHLGHGIGLFPHEAPHLNSHWDNVFAVGDVFTAEPGLYGRDLRGGIRLENDYLVTESGVELLTDFPLELT